MKVCVYADPLKMSPAMGRIAEALRLHLPEPHQFTSRAEDAGLVVFHTVGNDVIEPAAAALANGQRYAIIQYCLRSTQAPDTRSWLETWERAAAVWSYYDLPALIAEDGVDTWGPIDFYEAPLGVDRETFYPRITAGDRYACVTSGHLDGPEAIKEPTEAAERLGRGTYHLGPPIPGATGPNTEIAYQVPDAALAAAYCRADFVMGLRRVEGFEMPAAEGALCGARPVLFDRPHYRRWFEPWGIFVDEGLTPAELTDRLEEIFRTPQPMSEDERAAAAARFDWPSICAGFWSRALEGAGA